MSARRRGGRTHSRALMVLIDDTLLQLADLRVLRGDQLVEQLDLGRQRGGNARHAQCAQRRYDRAPSWREGRRAPR